LYFCLCNLIAFSFVIVVKTFTSSTSFKGSSSLFTSFEDFTSSSFTTFMGSTSSSFESFKGFKAFASTFLD